MVRTLIYLNFLMSLIQFRFTLGFCQLGKFLRSITIYFGSTAFRCLNNQHSW